MTSAPSDPSTPSSAPRPGGDAPALRGQERKLSEALGFGGAEPGVSVQIGTTGSREPKKAFAGGRAPDGPETASASAFGAGLTAPVASRPTGGAIADRLVAIPAGAWLSGEDRRASTVPALPHRP